jgi:hypothetical protein
MDGRAFSISEALRFGWETLKRNLGLSVGLVAAGAAGMWIVNGLAQATHRAPGLAMGFTLLSQLVQVFWAVVWIRFALAVHDGRSVVLRELVPDGRTFLQYLAVSILYGLLVIVGLVLLVVPGIYLAVRYGFAGFLVADGRAEVPDAFHQSSELTHGERWQLFAFALALLVINVIGAVLFGIGLLFTIPISAFAATLVYRRLLERAESRHRAFPEAPVPA